MIEISYLSLMVLGELVLILGLACGISLFLAIRRRKRDYQAAQNLAAAVQQDEERHESFVRRLLESGYHYQGEALNQTVRDLVKAEKLFYQTLINTYLKRDAATFGHLNITLEALTDIYEQLKIPTVPPGSAGGAGSNSEVDLEYLRDKNQRLSEELSETMDTMGRMLGEYSNLFDQRAGPTGNSGDEGSENTGETDLAQFEIPPRPAAGVAETQSLDGDPTVDSSALTNNAVDGLLEEAGEQVEDSIEPPMDEIGTIDLDEVSEANSSRKTQVVDQQDLSNAFDDLEEIDIETDVSRQEQDGKRQTN